MTASPPTVLGVTGHRRTNELEGPLQHVEGASTVAPDPSARWPIELLGLLVGVPVTIHRRDPDIVLLVGGSALLAVYTLLWCRLYHLPLVTRLMSDPWRLNREKLDEHRATGRYGKFAVRSLYAWLLFVTLDRADGHLAVSAELKRRAERETDCPADRIAVVPGPVDTAVYGSGRPDAGREAVGLGAERVILTVTNLSYCGKFVGACRSIRHVEPLLRSRPELVYVVAGDGRYRSALWEFVDQQIDDPSVRERIVLPGYVDDVADLYTMADVFFYLSYADGYPNAVIEAQAAGLPVVANARHGMVEQIEHGETGLLFDDRGDTGDTIRRLLDHPSERRWLGKNAANEVATRNDPVTIGGQMADALASIHVRATERTAHEAVPPMT